MNTVSLKSTKLPASAFPSPADVYVCDQCGRDITKHLHRGRAHVWEPMGPERYVCRCGQSYLTGAREWDHLSEATRKQRIVQIIVTGILFSVPFSFIGLGLYFWLHRSRRALIFALAMATIPFLVVFVPFFLSVAASMYRTRIRSEIMP